MKKEEQKRVNIAKDLGIEHFDISNHILFCRKNSNKIWGYFMKNYDFILKSMMIRESVNKVSAEYLLL